MIHKLRRGTVFQLVWNNRYLHIDQRQMCITSEFVPLVKILIQHACQSNTVKPKDQFSTSATVNYTCTSQHPKKSTVFPLHLYKFSLLVYMLAKCILNN